MTDYQVPIFKDENVFNKNLNHINQYDNTIVEKIPQVEYEIEIGNFGFDSYEKDADEDDKIEDKMMLGALPSQIDYNSRPLNSLDQLFEKRMKTRLSKYHAKIYDRIQYDD